MVMVSANRTPPSRRRPRASSILRTGVLCMSYSLVSTACGRTGVGSSVDEHTENGGSSAAPTGGGGGGRSGAGSSGATTGGSKAGPPPDCGPRIDDMEDEDGRICSGQGRVGAWYAFHDASPTAVQWPAETPAGTGIEMSKIPGGRGESQVGVHTYGGDFGMWGSGVGFDLDYDGVTYRPYDATRYRGIHFWARSTSRDYLRLRISTESTTDVKYGGTCDVAGSKDCAGPAGVHLPLETEWLDYTVTFEELGIASERSRLTNIQFMTKGNFDFWVDDVTFLEDEPSCCSTLPTCQDGVTFTDPTVRTLLALGDDGKLGCDRVCALRIVDLRGSSVEKLDGMECLGHLDKLTLDGTSVRDLAPLAGASRLHVLSMDGGAVHDLAPLGALRALRELSLNGNQLVDVLPLQNLLRLEALSLRSNVVVDLSPLAGLKALKSLTLADNQLRDASAVSGLSALTQLDLSQNELVSLGPALRLPSLEALNLDDNQLATITALVPLGALRSLQLNRNQLDDVSPLAALRSLEVLTLRENRITSPVGALSRLEALTYLDLSHNRITSVGTLSGLPKLTELGLANNQLTDAAGLAPLLQLDRLDLSHNQLGTLNGPFAFRAMSLLDVSDNGLASMPEGALSGSSVSILRLSKNQLRDLSALAHVTFHRSSWDLRCELDLSGNPVQDLSPLLSSTWCEGFMVHVDGAQLDCAAQASNIQALTTRGATVVGCP